MFLIFLNPCLAFTKQEIDNMFLNESYVTVSVEIPEFLYQPEKWVVVYNDISKTRDYSLTRLVSLNVGDFQKYTSKSIDKIAEEHGGYVYGSNSKYSYANIIVPNESYENLISVFKSVGFKIIPKPNAKPLLNDSKPSIKLPYIYPIDGSLEITGAGRVIAVIDSGVDDQHADLNGKIIFWNDTSTQRFPNPVDTDGHGTHVCSIAAGTGANNIIFRGVAPGADLMVWKVAAGSNWDIGWIAEADRQAIRQNPDVISMSLGIDDWEMNNIFGFTMQQACTGATTGVVREWHDAIVNAINSGIPVVIAAGNSGPGPSTIDFPACMQGVISVGSTLKKDYAGHYYPLYQAGDKARIRFRINIPTDNPPQSYTYEWTAWEYLSGFYKVVQPNTWPATIQVQVEGEQQIDDDWYLVGRSHWDPGNDGEGDKYWEYTQTFNQGPAIAIEAHAATHSDSWFCGNPVYWCYNHRFNYLDCSGTPIVCNNFDENKAGCENQAGCYWCGCAVETEGHYSYCTDKSQSDCHGCSGKDIEKCYVWYACYGTPTPCADRSDRDKGETTRETFCGTPETTGCTASWNRNSLQVDMFRVSSPSTEGLVSEFSSRGPAPQNPAIIQPIITAPGENICAARSGDSLLTDTNCGDNDYIMLSGTSMAAPHVAGLVALLREANPNSNLNQITNALTRTEEKLLIGDPDNDEGEGRIDVQKAVDYITDCSLKFQDGWYCNYDVRENRDYYYDDINTRECTFAVTQSENCDNYDGWYCNGNTREYRNYYCSAGSCAYSVTQSQNCGNDGGYADIFLPQCSGYNYISYTSANQMRDYYCSDGNCGSAVNFDSYITNVCTSGKCENYDNPVLYYKFDEGTGTTVHDSSGNARDGTTNAVWVDGHREKALNFTGLDYVRVPYNLNNLNSMSIEAWIKMNPYSEPRYFVIAAKTGGEWNAPDIDYDYKYTITPVASSIRFSYRYSGSKCSKGYTKNITDGRWHHIAVTLDATNNKIRFYADGNKDYETSGCGPINFTSYNTRAGQMIGLMDELKIYNKVIDYESPITYNSSNIVVDVDVKNTGTNQQAWWFIGVEFWKISDYNDPWNTRSMRVNAYYNGKDRTHGCTIDAGGYCPTGVDCYLISDPNGNGFLDVGETIKVRCQVPSSYYGLTTGNQRIMFWVHERDLGQDAWNNGNAGNDWWWDALSWANHADLRVKIECRTDAYDSDGGMSYLSLGTCTDYYQDGSTCKNTQYTDSCIDSNILREYYVSGLGCANVTKSCSDYGSNYVCSAGRCRYIGGGGGGGCLVEGTKILTPNGFKNIEDIKVGDMVIGYKDGKKIETKVTRKVTHFGFWDIYYYRGSWFTETHKIYPAWDGEATIASILSDVKKQYTGTVYDIETETHNYFGENDLLIHNMFMKMPLMV